MYEAETGFYYLGSRYYDPEVGRFINADGFVGTGVGILGYNMFAYCNNNPVVFCDSNGTRPIVSGSISDETPTERKMALAYMKKNPQKIIDVSEKLDNAMKTNAKVFEEYTSENNYIKSSRYFVSKVKPDGDWDFKAQDEWNLSPDTIYYYHGEKLRFDDIGNIHLDTLE